MKMRHVFPALIAAACCALAPAAAPAAQVGFMDVALAEGNPSLWASDLNALDAQVVRYWADWRDIAPSKPANPGNPGDSAYNWTRLDKLVRATPAGTPIILTIWHTPSWARKYALAPVYKAVVPRPKALGAFARALATRYSGTFAAGGSTLPRVTLFEAWNEPNQKGGLAPQSRGGKLSAPRDYAAMLNAVYANIHAVAKAKGYGVKVAGASLAPYAGKSGIAPLTFIKLMKAPNGKRPKMDVLALHPYPPYKEMLRTGPARVRAGDLSVQSLRGFLKATDKMLKKKYNVWLTEYGWQTEPDPFGASLSQQVDFLRTEYATIRSIPRIGYVINFLILDEADGGVGWQSGVRQPNGSPKPVYSQWLSVTRG